MAGDRPDPRGRLMAIHTAHMDRSELVQALTEARDDLNQALIDKEGLRGHLAAIQAERDGYRRRLRALSGIVHHSLTGLLETVATCGETGDGTDRLIADLRAGGPAPVLDLPMRDDRPEGA